MIPQKALRLVTKYGILYLKVGNGAGKVTDNDSNPIFIMENQLSGIIWT